MRPKLSFADRVRRAAQYARQQVERVVENYPDYFPAYTVGGRWKHEGKRWTNWCEGFLGGELWLLHRLTRDPVLREKAVHYCRLMEDRKDDRGVHDLGFLFWPSWKQWQEVTGDRSVKRVVIEAGRTLALRFQEDGGYLCSFVARNSTFIDIMMNVGIIYYAAQETGDDELRQIADRHCLTTRRYLVRGDGSTAQEAIFDPETGRFARHNTRQGWRSDSCWARGQAWALHGFAQVYEFTDDVRFLDTAEQCADYFIAQSPERGVPPNDFDAPGPDVPCDSSAAAVAADGLFDLADLSEDATRCARYRERALRILETLTEPEFLAVEKPEWEGILQHAVYHQPMGLGVDESVMWGDYYFLKALLKAMKRGL
jgi:unsaturated chondroitin disaccharide hydrolase